MINFMKVIIITICFSVMMTTTSEAKAAGSNCYKQAEFEAEQAVRIHTELMVIGLTCIRMPQFSGLYSKYQKFTAKNSKAISSYENVLISYFKRRNFKAPTKQLHNLRTVLSNHLSQKAIRMSIVSYCKKMGRTVDNALSMQPADFKNWVKKDWATRQTSRKLCKV